MDLIPINQHLEENKHFTDTPECQESIYMAIDFYKRTGYNPPWIGYYACLDDVLVGSAAFKGKPINGIVEIAYGTFPAFRQQRIGTLICAQLALLAQRTDPSVIVTARTLQEENYSTKILRKNNFVFSGAVSDPEDGAVWEWVLQHPRIQAP